MLLTLIRHAEASLITTSDFERELTERGKQQADRLGIFFSKIKEQPQLILSSPVARARQTAEAISKRIESATFFEQPWLACGMKPEMCLQELHAFLEFQNIILVGHEPDLSSTMAFLLGTENPGGLQVRKAGICSLEMGALYSGNAVLQYFLPPDLLPLL